MKIKNVVPFGSLIRHAWNIYEDEKDTGVLMVSHLFLIVGLSYPVWLADDRKFDRRTLLFFFIQWKIIDFRTTFSTI